MRLKIIMVCSLLIVAFSAATHAAHGFHSWKKVTEVQGVNGQVLCKWYCDGIFGKESHYQETSGAGSCRQP
jgi:hypothetical protein